MRRIIADPPLVLADLVLGLRNPLRLAGVCLITRGWAVERIVGWPARFAKRKFLNDHCHIIIYTCGGYLRDTNRELAFSG